MWSFAQISDTHIVADPHGEVFGVKTQASLRGAVQELLRLGDKLKFVVHTGDIVHKENQDAYPAVAELLKEIKVPIYYARGNYDDTSLMNQHLTWLGQRKKHPNPKKQTYSFTQEGEHFIVLDSALAQPDWCGVVEEEELTFLTEELAAGHKTVTIFVHYPAFGAGSPWAERQMVLNNGTELHAILKGATKTQIRGVFCGHIHRYYSVAIDGILYASAPATAARFKTCLDTEQLEIDTHYGPAFNIITCDGDRTIVREFIAPIIK